MKIKDDKMKLLLIIIALTVIISGVAYAFTGYMATSNNNTFNTGKINFVYTENANNISLNGYDMLDDEDGKILNEYFSFNIKANATGKTKLGYYINFTEDINNTLEKDAIKIYLTKVNNENDAIENEIEIMTPIIASSLKQINKNTLKVDNSSQEYFIYSDEFDLNNSTQTHYYRLRLWVNSDYPLNNHLQYTDIENGTKVTIDKLVFKAKINVVGYNGEKLTIE